MRIKLLVVCLVASAFFLWLSGRILGGDGMGRGLLNDGLFDADIAHYTNILTGPSPPRPSPLHALVNFVYRPPTLLLAKILGAVPR